MKEMNVGKQLYKLSTKIRNELGCDILEVTVNKIGFSLRIKLHDEVFRGIEKQIYGNIYQEINGIE